MEKYRHPPGQPVLLEVAVVAAPTARELDTLDSSAKHLVAVYTATRRAKWLHWRRFRSEKPECDGWIIFEKSQFQVAFRRGRM